MTTDASASRPAPHGAALSPGRSRLDSMSPSKRALFEKRLGGQRSRPVEALTRVPRGGDLPVSPAQRRLWFMDQLVPGSAMFNVPTALRLTGALRLDVLTDAVRALVDRHEALRTVFAANEGDPVQRILSDSRWTSPRAHCPSTTRRCWPPYATRRVVRSPSPTGHWLAPRCSGRRPPRTCWC
ncbi:condensation domain-containing protein [Micromonospora sp. NPDC005553]|uniref:condensation domain-containing protein n=1 Tax=Micromonospora sp. NPDC005553 TaxID=3364232 RepID=UPI003682FACB